MYFKTNNESIGAKKVGENKFVTYSWVNGNKVAEIVEDAQEIADVIGDQIPKIQSLANQILGWIKDITNPFPTAIKRDGLTYKFTEQRAPFEAIDEVFYMCVEDRSADHLFHFQHKKMFKAKQALKQALKNEKII